MMDCKVPCERLLITHTVVLLHVHVAVARDVTAPFPRLVTVAVTVGTKPPVTVTVARLVKSEGHAVGTGLGELSGCENSATQDSLKELQRAI